MAGGAAAAAIVFLVLIMNFASKPSYSTLMTGVDPTQTGKITSTLSTKGIGYQIQNNGTAIAVAVRQDRRRADRAGHGGAAQRHLAAGL